MNRRDRKNDSDSVVIKVGGSLLTKPGLPAALQQWVQSDPLVQGKSQRLFVVGGGEAVNALRAIDAANPLPPEVAHWAAIDVMDQNARLLASWMEMTTLTTSFTRIKKRASGDWILAPGPFLRREEPSLPGIRLPVGWEVTSDSIAARLAGLLGGSLVLLKSSPPPPCFVDGDWQKASERGYIDSHFPLGIMDRLRVNAVFLDV